MFHRPQLLFYMPLAHQVFVLQKTDVPIFFFVLSPNNTTKPTQMGFKLCSLADMDDYLYHCEVYQGKNQTFVDE